VVVEQTIYLYSAVAGCTLVLIQVVLQLFGLFGDTDMDGHDAHVDTGDGGGDSGDHAGDPQGHGNFFFGILSFKALCAFAGIFGLVGLMLTKREWSMGARVLAATTAGFAGMVVVAWLMRGIARLQASGTVEIHNAVGRTGSVYLRIPASRGGAGKVTIEIQGRSMEFPAITTGDALPTGARVTVVSVEGDDTLEVAAL